MNPNLAYWTLAAAIMTGTVSCLWLGVRAIRRHQVETHRRLMLSASGLVGLFVLSYLVKLGVLGREQLSLWAPADVWVLRFHETCIAFMLIGGATALTLALRLGFPIEDPERHADPDAIRARIRLHRRAGRTAVAAASIAFLAAAVVLYGMFARAL